MIWADRVVALLVALYVATAFGLAYAKESDSGHIMCGAIGLTPCLLLLIPKPGTMLVVTVMSVPCCAGASMYSDVAQLPPLSDKLLSGGNVFMLAVGLYSFVRVIQLARKTAR